MNLGFTELVVVFSIIVLLVFVTAMVSGVGLKLGRQLKPKQTTPLEIAQARYARGEITREQYEQMKKEFGIK